MILYLNFFVKKTRKTVYSITFKTQELQANGIENLLLRKYNIYFYLMFFILRSEKLLNK